MGDVQSKYGNRKTVVDGITFDSKKEADRYIELKYMERAGLIRCLELQPKYCLIPTLEGSNGKIAQRAVYYRADFEYLEKNKLGGWNRVVEDVKGCRTDVYKLKKKLLRWRLGIEIREV